MYSRYARVLIFFLALSPLSAWEFGFLLSNEFRSENFSGAQNNANELYEAGRLSMWLSFRPYAKTALYLKGSVQIFNEALLLNPPEDWKYFGELDMLQLSVSPSRFFYAELGRIHFEDSLSLVASGLFDGASIMFGGGRHNLILSALYTGFLYKETAKIFLTREERKTYYDVGYFAPPHLVMSAQYQFAASPQTGSVFELNLLWQVDTREHSQNQTTYVISRVSAPVSDQIRLFGGAVFSWAFEDGKTFYSLSSTFQSIINTTQFIPAQFNLGVTVFWGTFEDDAQSMPVITHPRLGVIYQPEPRRIVMISAEYLASLSSALTFSGSLRAFVRVDTDARPSYWLYSDFEVEDSSGLLLGEELSIGAIWTPLSDISLNTGVMFFFPDNSPGGVYAPGTPIQWNLKLGVLFSF